MLKYWRVRLDCTRKNSNAIVHKTLGIVARDIKDVIAEIDNLEPNSHIYNITHHGSINNIEDSDE